MKPPKCNRCYRPSDAFVKFVYRALKPGSKLNGFAATNLCFPCYYAHIADKPQVITELCIHTP